MSYFRNFPVLQYVFGNENYSVSFNKVGTYIDLVDQLKDDAAFYTYYDVRDGDRPDQIANKLYGNPEYHWTFFLLNDDLRRDGWPLTEKAIKEKGAHDYPEETVTTRAEINERFLINSVVEGATSGAKGKIVDKRFDFGQLVLDRCWTEGPYYAFGTSANPTTGVKSEGYHYPLYMEEEFANAASSDGTSHIHIFDEFPGEVLFMPNKFAANADSFGFTRHVRTRSEIEADFGTFDAFTEDYFDLLSATRPFVAKENIITTEDGLEQQIKIDAWSKQYNATHHYENTDKKYVDVLPYAPYTQRLESVLTFSSAGSGDYLISQNIISGPTGVEDIFDLGGIAAGTFLSNLLGELGGPLATFVTDLGEALAAGPVSYTGVLALYRDAWKALGLSDSLYNTIVAYVTTKIAGSVANLSTHAFYLIDGTGQVVLGPGVGYCLEDKTLDVGRYLSYYSLPDGTAQLLGTFDEDARSAAFQIIVDKFESYISTNYDTVNKPALLTPVTYLERMRAQNDELKKIKVLKPAVIDQVVDQFNDILRQDQQFNDDTTVLTSTTGQTNLSGSQTSGSSSSSTATNTVSGSSSSSSGSSGGSSY